MTGSAFRMTSAAPTPLPARHAPTAETAHAIAIALVEGFNRHYALFRECARAARRHFDAGNWLAIQHVGRDRIDFYDRRVAGDCRSRPSRVPERGPRHRHAVGAGQAPLHRAPDRPQAAGVRRDVLQLGVGQGPPPRLFPQQVHLRPAGDLDRAHRRRSAVIPQLLSAAGGAAQRARRHRPRFRLRAPFRRFRPRPAQRARRVPPSVSAAVPARSRITRSRCCPRRSCATRPPTSSGGSSTASTPIRSSCRSSTTRRGGCTSTRC